MLFSDPEGSDAAALGVTGAPALIEGWALVDHEPADLHRGRCQPRPARECGLDPGRHELHGIGGRDTIVGAGGEEGAAHLRK